MSGTPLNWSFADARNDDEFAAFTCWDGTPGCPWIEEVDQFVRVWAVREKGAYLVAVRNEHQQLVAVAAFADRIVHVPIVDPVSHPGWHLLVLAIDLDHQGNGLSREVFSCVFEAMRAKDERRVLYTADVHRQNAGSLAACARVGLLPFIAKDDHYLTLLGEVPDAGS